MRTAPVLMVALALSLTIGLAQASAQSENRAAFSVERFVPTPGAGGFLAAQDAQVLERGSWSISVWGSLMHEPLVLQDIVSGQRVSAPVRVRLGYELAAALGVLDRLELGLAMPVVAAQDGDRLQGIDLDEAALAPIAAGDLRFHGKLRLTDRGLGFGLGVVARATLPTGNHQHFAGEAAATLAWSLVIGYRARHWRVGGSVGPRLRTERVVLLSPARAHAGELETRVAGELWLFGPRRLSILAEYAAIRGDATTASTSVRGPSPAEARAGLRMHRGNGWSLIASAGVGTTPAEVGSPDWRMVLGARFQAPPPRP